METIRFAKVAEVPAFPGDYALVTQSVSDDGTLLFLYVESAGQDAVHGREIGKGGARFARTRMEAPMRFRLVKISASRRVVVDLPPLDVTFPLIDVFPDGRVLVAGARCAWYAEGEFDLNGVLIDPASGKYNRILLGDGIARVFVDGRARIWVSYYDEGIYGNFGWGNPGPKPVGAAGLVCFSALGEKLWEPSSDVAECCVLNVCGSEVYAYTDPQFSISRVSHDFSVTTWSTKLQLCGALAVGSSSVLFTGLDHSPPGTGCVGVLDGGALRDARTVRLELPDGTILPERGQLARGGALHCFTDDAVYRATLK